MSPVFSRNGVQRGVRILQHLEEDLLVLLLAAITLLVFVEVVLRFGFNFAFLWMQELTLYLGAWMVLSGASYGVKTGTHLAVDAFLRHLPPGLQRGARLLAVGLCLLYCGLLLYGAWVYLAKLRLLGIEMEDLPLPRWLAQSVLVPGLLLLVLRFLQVGQRVLQGRSEELPFSETPRSNPLSSGQIRAKRS